MVLASVFEIPERIAMNAIGQAAFVVSPKLKQFKAEIFQKDRAGLRVGIYNRTGELERPASALIEQEMSTALRSSL